MLYNEVFFLASFRCNIMKEKLKVLSIHTFNNFFCIQLHLNIDIFKRILFIFICSIFQFSIFSLEPSPLDLLRSGRRIFKGKGTKIKYYPFMASVQAFNRFMCGGSIIKADLVITAASCLQL